jgi:hypothetical protein
MLRSFFLVENGFLKNISMRLDFKGLFGEQALQRSGGLKRKGRREAGEQLPVNRTGYLRAKVSHSI